MPTVFTIQGTSEGTSSKACKDVRNSKTGCVTQLCPTTDSKTGRRVMRFKKGSTRCPRRGR